MKYYLLFLILFLFKGHTLKAYSLNEVQKQITYLSQIKNITSIGIVDFRKILKDSITMKNVGKQFLMFEKILNDKIKSKEKSIREEEDKLFKEKDKLELNLYNNKKKKIKQDIANLQKYALNEKNKLNISFQNIQKKLKSILASIIRDISKTRGIDIVLLKENAFLFNNENIEFSKEALDSFDERTKSLKITIN